MNTSETTEQAIRRISTAPWVKVQRGDQTGEHMATEHALRRPGAPSTRCSISLVHLKSSQADGTRPPCRSCLRSIEADAAMQIPIPGPDGALAQAVARAAEFRDAARTLAGMLADAKVHPATIGAVLVTVVSQDTAEEVMAPWR